MLKDALNKKISTPGIIIKLNNLSFEKKALLIFVIFNIPVFITLLMCKKSYCDGGMIMVLGALVNGGAILVSGFIFICEKILRKLGKESKFFAALMFLLLLIFIIYFLYGFYF